MYTGRERIKLDIVSAHVEKNPLFQNRKTVVTHAFQGPDVSVDFCTPAACAAVAKYFPTSAAVVFAVKECERHCALLASDRCRVGSPFLFECCHFGCFRFFVIFVSKTSTAFCFRKIYLIIFLHFLTFCVLLAKEAISAWDTGSKCFLCFLLFCKTID